MAPKLPPVRGLALLVAVAFLLAGCGDDQSTSTPEPDRSFDADRAFADLEAQVAIGPRPSGSAANERTAEMLASRLREAGVEDVQIQHPWRNVVGTIPGDESDAIVLGAHFDSKDIPGFVGANDGASGVAVVLELARVLAAPLNGPSVQIALFDAEEARGDRPFEVDGTRGSRQYVQLARQGGGQGTLPLRRIESMILFDMVGDCDLAIPREAGSDPKLYAEIAMAGAPFGGASAPVLDDHVPFADAGVRAVDLIDFDFGPGPSPGAYWHTTEDTLDKVCPESLDAVGEAVLRILPAATL
jgi:Zn-dependent M28 family amino/carboxypeptidase